jgi:hypothetical protein
VVGIGVGVLNPFGSGIAVGVDQLDAVGVAVGVGVAASATSVPINRAKTSENAEIIARCERFIPLVGL